VTSDQSSDFLGLELFLDSLLEPIVVMSCSESEGGSMTTNGRLCLRGLVEDEGAEVEEDVDEYSGDVDLCFGR
jgi:hypothetical protein